MPTSVLRVFIHYIVLAQFFQVVKPSAAVLWNSNITPTVWTGKPPSRFVVFAQVVDTICAYRMITWHDPRVDTIIKAYRALARIIVYKFIEAVYIRVRLLHGSHIVESEI
jgi:hypothetical protein